MISELQEESNNAPTISFGSGQLSELLIMDGKVHKKEGITISDPAFSCDLFMCNYS